MDSPSAAMLRHPLPTLLAALASAGIAGAAAPQQVGPPLGPELSGHADANDPGILDPVLVALGGLAPRVPGSHQISDNSELLNIVGGIGGVKRKPAAGQASANGTTIARTDSPNRALEDAVKELERAASAGNAAGMAAPAQRAAEILLGLTHGDIFDGFAQLNHARGAFLPGHEPGLERARRLRDSGLTAPGPDGAPRRIWELDVQLLWYDDEADADTSFFVVPAGADDFDLLRVHYRILSTEGDDFAPGVLLADARPEGGTALPFKALDASWVRVPGDGLTELTVQYPPLGQIRALQSWGWRAQPWRSHLLLPLRELVNAHTGAVELEPRGQALAAASAARDLASIGTAAPERKILSVLEAIQAGAGPAAIAAMMNSATTPPFGTWQDWTRELADRRALPLEAQAILAQEGIFPDRPGRRPLGPYDAIAVWTNHEPRLLVAEADPFAGLHAPSRLPGAAQGDLLRIKILNLDTIARPLQVDELGPPLHFDIKNCNYAPAGGHSLEIASWKPWFGAPKFAELEWRAGWGFRPHHDVIAQYDVFPRAADRALLLPYADGHGRARLGWQYPAALRGGDFVFDPPREWIGTPGDPSPAPLREANGAAGLVIGVTTPGYGVARVCDHAADPPGSWCSADLAAFNPYGELNFDSDGDGVPDQLRFPPWLRNPVAAGGDLIPATRAWEPFLYLNPANGSIYLDPARPEDGLWSERSFAFGAPIAAGTALNAEILAKRALPQALWLSDGLHAADGGVAIELKD